MSRICNSLRYIGVLTFCCAAAPLATAQQTDSSTIQPDGTAIVTRSIPIPKTISSEAQRMLARQVSDSAVPQTLAERRTHTDEWQNRTGKVFQQQLGPALTHLFNHQTHHRGQAHAALTILGIAEPASFDLLVYQRS